MLRHRRKVGLASPSVVVYGQIWLTHQANGYGKDAHKREDCTRLVSLPPSPSPIHQPLNDGLADTPANKVTQDSVPQQNVTVTGEEAAHLDENDQRAKEIRAEFADTPRTPLGGHDPTAPNAPSFAAAAAL